MLMIILVTGWRHHCDPAFVAAQLDLVVGKFSQPAERIELIHGACPSGADAHADTWGSRNAWQVTRFPAERYGKWPECGPIRNKVMVHYFDAHHDLNKFALAFPQVGWRGRPRCGTRSCIEALQLVGHPPAIYEAL